LFAFFLVPFYSPPGVFIRKERRLSRFRFFSCSQTLSWHDTLSSPFSSTFVRSPPESWAPRYEETPAFLALFFFSGFLCPSIILFYLFPLLPPFPSVFLFCRGPLDPLMIFHAHLPCLSFRNSFVASFPVFFCFPTTSVPAFRCLRWAYNSSSLTFDRGLPSRDPPPFFFIVFPLSSSLQFPAPNLFFLWTLYVWH